MAASKRACAIQARVTQAYRNVAEVLGEVGASFPDVVRVDQYYTTARAMHPYHEVRHEVFKGTIPPSTSNLHQRFARTEQTIEVQVMAAVPGAGLTVKHETLDARFLMAGLRVFDELIKSVKQIEYLIDPTGARSVSAAPRPAPPALCPLSSRNSRRIIRAPNFG